ncbi:hypothetical protein J3L11_18835, partial [Shewanella sp. 4t3-1-2LB]|uniref:hypothetical protein n=1 Tax=Shewanella sp. 4t3-1-2LB TaxID=2817682 RepID=UPI001A982EC9
DIVILNFFENCILKKWPILHLTKAFFILVLLKVVVRKIIWIRHNYYPHDYKKEEHSTYYGVICDLLYRFSTDILAHRPVPELGIMEYVPHPQYYCYSNSCDSTKHNTQLSFLYFGQVKSYKGLTQLLNAWPSDYHLRMLGKSDSELLTLEIKKIISDRNLNVTWENAFVEKKVLNDIILQSDYVIIPHIDDSMIVTGAAYHAISLGCNVILNESNFAKWFKSEYPFASNYDRTSLMQTLSKCVKTNRKDILDFVANKNGDIVLMSSWEYFFNKTSVN